MIRINLLPYREKRKKENVRRQVSIFALSFILFMFALFYLQKFLNNKIQTKKVEIASTKNELIKYDAINKEIDEITKKLDVLQKKTTVIQNLQLQRHKAVQLLDMMTQAIVAKRMWFTRLESGINTVTIEGIALDNKTVADFMTNLVKTRLFAAVNLKSTRQEIIREKNINLKKFEVVCNQVPLPSAAGTAGKAGAAEKKK
ncbi:MAG: pilus assembly protein PilN [Desulfobacterales bacterium CG07_land_8_20_14_0_80_52_14]|nr:MAG: pilus assembly protein PilN [Desulfobacterales bacterium CG23_combo_of_CG06-09_8_20_14_all_52_9]PIU50351.1 MAG: pilus assembly protein PilN [Desulfobacterales bacterium CG07_land_8_20_14_0_80_52_14]